MGLTTPEDKTIRRVLKLKEIEQVLPSNLGLRQTLTVPADQQPDGQHSVKNTHLHTHRITHLHR
jgi:hypothetical protein